VTSSASGAHPTFNANSVLLAADQQHTSIRLIDTPMA